MAAFVFLNSSWIIAYKSCMPWTYDFLKNVPDGVFQRLYYIRCRGLSLSHLYLLFDVQNIFWAIFLFDCRECHLKALRWNTTLQSVRNNATTHLCSQLRRFCRTKSAVKRVVVRRRNPEHKSHSKAQNINDIPKIRLAYFGMLLSKTLGCVLCIYVTFIL